MPGAAGIFNDVANQPAKLAFGNIFGWLDRQPGVVARPLAERLPLYLLVLFENFLVTAFSHSLTIYQHPKIHKNVIFSIVKITIFTI